MQDGIPHDKGHVPFFHFFDHGKQGFDFAESQTAAAQIQQKQADSAHVGLQQFELISLQMIQFGNRSMDIQGKMELFEENPQLFSISSR